MGVDHKKNLLQETKNILTDLELTFDDVNWIGSLQGYYYERDTWEEKLNFDYNFGYGMGVDPDLVVVGDDWWLERDREFNDHWIYKTLPQKPDMKLEEFEKKYYNTDDWEEI